MQAIKVWNSAIPADHYGSVGCLVRWLDRVGLLSASHVLSPVWSGISVGTNHDITVLPEGKIGTGELANWNVPMAPDGTPLTGSRDAAFATVDDATERNLIETLGLPTGIRRAQQYGQEAHFFGATSGRCKHTIIHDLAACITMRYRLYNNDDTLNYSSVDVTLSGLLQCDAQEPVLPGDSGCLLFDSEGYALGLLVGTDPTNTYPYFTHLQPILDLFGIQLISASDYPLAERLKDLV